MTHTSTNGQVVITIRQQYRGKTAWALHVAGQYKGTKVLPSNNTAVVQNFGYLAADFK